MVLWHVLEELLFILRQLSRLSNMLQHMFQTDSYTCQTNKPLQNNCETLVQKNAQQINNYKTIAKQLFKQTRNKKNNYKTIAKQLFQKTRNK